MRRLALTAAALLALVAAPAADARRAATPPSWASKDIATVVARGLLPGVTAATFQPDLPLDSATLQTLVVGALPQGSVRARVPAGRTALTIGQLDAAIVRAAGLGPDAARALAALRARRLQAPRRRRHRDHRPPARVSATTIPRAPTSSSAA